MREYNFAWPGFAYDGLHIVHAQVENARVGRGLEEGDIDNEHVATGVRGGQLGEKTRIYQERQLRPVDIERNAEGVRTVVVRNGCRECEIAELVAVHRLHHDNLVKKRAEIAEHDAVIAFKACARSEQGPAFVEAAAGHRVDHDIHVAAVIDVAVREDNPLEVGGIDRRIGLRAPDQRAGAGIEVHTFAAKAQINAAGRARLPRHHPAGARRAHEPDVVAVRHRIDRL